MSGGGYEYNFYPTAIGTSGVCICSTCRSKAIRYVANNSTIVKKAIIVNFIKNI